VGENRCVLRATERPLDEIYDVAALDLDGVVYVGRHAVEGAAEGLEAARRGGMHLAFITNNAARPPAEVAAHLRELGIPAEDSDVVTSAQAAARLLAGQVPAGGKVYVIGGEGLHAALRERGLEPVVRIEDDPVAVIQGYGPDMPWRQVIDGAILVSRGLPWVASNMDLTVPTSHGPGPGNGALVNLVATHAGRRPQVAGKPAAPLFEETLARVGGQRPLVVGDRLDTDIDGAHNVGWDSLLVMTGVTTLVELATLERTARPTYVGADLGCLALPVTETTVDGDVQVGGWTSTIDAGRLRVEGDGDRHDWYRAAAAALWGHLDATGHAADPGDAGPPR
jgi:HAD superfamily hydrolase (TIGR01450 family)